MQFTGSYLELRSPATASLEFLLRERARTMSRAQTDRRWRQRLAIKGLSWCPKPPLTAAAHSRSTALSILSSGSGCFVRSGFFLLLCTTLTPPTSWRLLQVSWCKCVREIFSVQTHTHRHTLRSRRQQALGTLLLTVILEIKEFLENSFQPFPALEGAGREQLYFSQIVQIPECSCTYIKNPEHGDSPMLLRNTEPKRGLLGHPVFSLVTGDTASYVVVGPPNTVDKQAEHNFEMSWADLSSTLTGRLSQGHPALAVGSFLAIFCLNFTHG